MTLLEKTPTKRRSYKNIYIKEISKRAKMQKSSTVTPQFERQYYMNTLQASDSLCPYTMAST